MTTTHSPAEEAIVYAMLSTVVVSGGIAYLTLRVIGEWTMIDAGVAGGVALILSTHTVPVLCSWWLGVSVEAVLDG